MAYFGIAVALVGLVQSVAWIGSASVGARRRRQAVALSAIAVVVLLLSFVHLLVPGFWD